MLAFHLSELLFSKVLTGFKSSSLKEENKVTIRILYNVTFPNCSNTCCFSKKFTKGMPHYLPAFWAPQVSQSSFLLSPTPNTACLECLKLSKLGRYFSDESVGEILTFWSYAAGQIGPCQYKIVELCCLVLFWQLNTWQIGNQNVWQFHWEYLLHLNFSVFMCLTSVTVFLLSRVNLDISR